MRKLKSCTKQIITIFMSQYIHQHKFWIKDFSVRYPFCEKWTKEIAEISWIITDA